jgi:hypothetical protein
MLLQLVYEDQWVIPVPVDARVHEALDVQRERAHRCEMDEAFAYQLSVCVANSLAAFLDPDLQLPTASQVKYATDIASQLGISIPAEALRYRGTCHEFIGRFEEAFKASRKLYSAATNPPRV